VSECKPTACAREASRSFFALCRKDILQFAYGLRFRALLLSMVHTTCSTCVVAGVEAEPPCVGLQHTRAFRSSITDEHLEC
jgi:hypothetical protein